MIVGNDISAIGQGRVDFDTYSKNANFVICKATEGSAFVDPQLVRNQSESRRVGLPLGYYHFARPSADSDPTVEAQNFVNAIGKLQDGEVLALDFEESYKDAVPWCKKWLDLVAERTNGTKPLIYMDNFRRTAYDWRPVVNAGYGLWLADYTYDPTKHQFPASPWSFIAIQQWTNRQQVPGISGNVDGDAFFGDIATFKKYGYKKPTPTDPCASQNAEIISLKQQLKISQDLVQTLQTKIDKAKEQLS